MSPDSPVDIIAVYSKLAEAESFFKALTHSNFSKIIKIRRLPPEQAEQQRRLRSVMQVRDLEHSRW